VDTIFEVRLVTSLPAPLIRVVVRRRHVFIIIARDSTDNIAMNFDLCVVVHVMACTAAPSV
jgi:Na+/serine symporter